MFQDIVGHHGDGNGNRNTRQLVTRHPQSGSREMNAGAQIFLLSIQSRVADHGMVPPHLGWAFPPQLTQSRNSLA